MTPPKGAMEILQARTKLQAVAELLSERAKEHGFMAAADAEALRQRVRQRAIDLLDEWSHIAHDYQQQGVQFQYQSEVGAAKPLLYHYLDSELKKLHPRHKKFRANRSMRDVEAAVNVWVKTLDEHDVDVEEDPT